MFNTKGELKTAINLYCENQQKCLEQYGDPNSWDVSNVTNMNYMFIYSVIQLSLIGANAKNSSSSPNELIKSFDF